MSLQLATFECDRCALQTRKSGFGLPEGWANVIVQRPREPSATFDVCPTCLRAIDAEFANARRTGSGRGTP